MGKQDTRKALALPRSSGHAPIALVTSKLAGGKARFMEFAQYVAQLEPESDLVRVVETYNSLNGVGRRNVSIDALCAHHKVDPVHFIGVVGEAALKFRDNSAIVMIAMSMPSIVDRSIRQALRPDGDKDRKMLFQHAGIVPVPAGQTINVGASASAMAGAKADGAPADTPKGLPSFERTMMDSDAILRERE